VRQRAVVIVPSSMPCRRLKSHERLHHGGCGFIGSHLAERLIARGDSVTVLDDLSTGSMDNIAHLVGRPGFHHRIDPRWTGLSLRNSWIAPTSPFTSRPQSASG
jgi:hypothetical protein